MSHNDCAIVSQHHGSWLKALRVCYCMNINIVNMRNVPRHSCTPVDRRTPLGNRFIIGQDGSRDEVCDKYDADFEYLLLANNAAQAQFQDLCRRARNNEEINLGCWCAPERCHAQTIRREIIALINQGT